uniref:BZIP domain-containing protein n=1 Tax=Brassica campestris TaxID=3711 RepID=M4E0W2_BRACM
MGTQINFNNLGGGGGGGDPGGEGFNQMKATDTAYPLARQSSLYSRTFDELQSLLGGPGKDYGSMNMDELLKSIWTAEEAQAMSMTMTSSAATTMVQPGGNLQRQGSLTLPRTISQKTVDEVWKCLITKDGGGSSGGGGGESNNAPQRQQTLGEMTLEDFLFRAGVVREDNNSSQQMGQVTGNNNNGFYGNNGAPGGLGFEFAFTGPVGMVNKSFNGAVNNSLNNTNGLASFGGTGVTVAATSPGTSSAENNSLSPVPYVLNRGRRSNTGLEKVIERRQRRMIKNRESAARSRARKQAYTLELEAEIEKLKKVNQELQRKQAEMMEMQKNELKESSKKPWGSKRQCLRRTLTGPW